MNGNILLQDTETIALQIVGEGREAEDAVPTSNEPLQPQVPSPDQEKVRLKSCSETVCWKCKLWMVAAVSISFLIIIVTILVLFFSPVVYIDEDEYWDPDSIASGNRHNFSGMLRIHCGAPQLLPSDWKYDLLSEYIHKRLTDVYSNSPALGRYFISAEVTSIRPITGNLKHPNLTEKQQKEKNFNWWTKKKQVEKKLGDLLQRVRPEATKNKLTGNQFVTVVHTHICKENSTVSYHLCFSVPSDETEEFMKYRMSENFLMNVLRQDIYDKEDTDGVNITGCTNMTLDPTSISLKQQQAAPAAR